MCLPVFRFSLRDLEEYAELLAVSLTLSERDSVMATGFDEGPEFPTSPTIVAERCVGLL